MKWKTRKQQSMRPNQWQHGDRFSAALRLQIGTCAKRYTVADMRYIQLTYYIVKVAVTAILVVLISEISKRSSFIGAVLASVPLTSVLAMIWLYLDTGNAEKVSDLANSVFWLVLPSLALFIALPVLLAQGINFYLSLTISIGVTAICYWGMVIVLRYYGVGL